MPTLRAAPTIPRSTSCRTDPSAVEQREQSVTAHCIASQPATCNVKSAATSSRQAVQAQASWHLVTTWPWRPRFCARHLFARITPAAWCSAEWARGAAVSPRWFLQSPTRCRPLRKRMELAIDEQQAAISANSTRSVGSMSRPVSQLSIQMKNSDQRSEFQAWRSGRRRSPQTAPAASAACSRLSRRHGGLYQNKRQAL